MSTLRWLPTARILLILGASFLGVGAGAEPGAEPVAVAGPRPGGEGPKAGVVAPGAGVTCSSLDPAGPNEERIPAGTVALAEADLAAVFTLYETISGRSVIPGRNLPATRLSYRLQLTLPRREVLQALDTLLAQNGITLITMGSNFMKAVIEAEASREAAPETSLPAHLLPDSNTYLQYAIRLQHRAVNDVIPILQPLCRLPNSLMTMPSSNSLIIRDYSANVRRMLGVLQRFDVPDNGEVLPEPTRRPRRPPAANPQP